MELQINNIIIRLTKYWYGLFHCQLDKTKYFSIGFLHFVVNPSKEEILK